MGGTERGDAWRSFGCVNGATAASLLFTAVCLLGMCLTWRTSCPRFAAWHGGCIAHLVKHLPLFIHHLCIKRGQRGVQGPIQAVKQEAVGGNRWEAVGVGVAVGSPSRVFETGMPVPLDACPLNAVTLSAPHTISEAPMASIRAAGGTVVAG